MDHQLTFEQSCAAVNLNRMHQTTHHVFPGVLHVENQKYSYAMSILKSNQGNPDSCLRFTFAYGRFLEWAIFIHTYMHDGNPLPSFEGEPKPVEIEGNIDEFTDKVWNSLNEDNKVSLFVRFIDIETGKWESVL